MRAPAIGSWVGGVSWAKELPVAKRQIMKKFQNTFMLSKHLFNHELPERKVRVEEILPQMKCRASLRAGESCLFWTAPAERSGDGALDSTHEALTRKSVAHRTMKPKRCRRFALPPQSKMPD